MDGESTRENLLAAQQKTLNDAIRQAEVDDGSHERSEMELRRKAVEALLSSPDICSELDGFERSVVAGIFGGASYRELEKQLGKSKSTIERTLKAATGKMRDHLQALSGATPAGVTEEQWEHLGIIFGFHDKYDVEDGVSREDFREAFSDQEDGE